MKWRISFLILLIGEAKMYCLSWVYNLYMDGVRLAGEDIKLLENDKEWRVPCLFYAHDLGL